MAAAKCNISFEIDYQASAPVTDATASYVISGSGKPPIVYNILPIPATGSLVTLPDIITPGKYDLTVTLTVANGIIARTTSSFQIGNCRA